MQYRADIDGLRAVAVLAVVLCHIFPDILPNGYMGVDVFFVISGFLITRIIYDEHKEGRFSLLQFYERRVRRILPALFVMCGATLVAAWFLFMPEELRLYAKSLASSVLFSSNFIFRAEEGYFAAENITRPLLHTWSLSVEEQFYIIFPLFLGWVMTRLKTSWCKPLTAIAIVAGVSFLLNLIFVWDGHPKSSFFLLPMRAWELLVGSWLAIYLIEKGPLFRSHVPTGWIGVALIAAGFLVSVPEEFFPGFYALLPVLGAAFILHGNAGRYDANAILFSRGAMVGVGKISYSLYLWHWPLWVFVSSYALGNTTMVHGGAVVIASFIMGFLSWKFVETPFRGSNALWSRRQLFTVMGGIGGVLALCGVIIYATNGARFKFAPDILKYANVKIGEPYPEIDTGPNDRTSIFDPAPTAPAPSIVVWGDSHAEAIAPALSELAKKRGWNGLLIKGNSCFVSPEDLSLQAKKVPDLADCAAGIPIVQRYLADHLAIHTVVMANRWAEQMAAWHKGDDRLTREDAMALRLSSLEAQVKRLRAMGKRVVILAQAPQVKMGNESVPSVLGRMALYGIPAGEIRPTIEAYKAEQADMWPIYQKLATMDGVSVVWPHETLCPSGYCTVVDDGGVYFFDDDHLSAYGARQLVPLFEKVIPSK